jgi:3-methyladenine DNA glycosylase AlkD
MVLKSEGSFLKDKGKPTKEVIKAVLRELADKKYREFISKLTPKAGEILGVRLPLLRRLGREIARGDWRCYLAQTDDEYFEEIMLQGIVIGLVKTSIEEKLRLVAGFLPKINNWAVCDSFCAGLKFAGEDKARVWEFLQGYFNSDREFEIRFAVVMLINYYIESDYIGFFPGLFDKIRHDGYYVKMAVAWASAACYAKYPEQTMAYLENNDLDDFTHNMALRKIIESRKTDRETREIIRGMRRKNRTG